MSVSNGILSCYEFGMFWNRKVHVGFSTDGCAHPSLLHPKKTCDIICRLIHAQHANIMFTFFPLSLSLSLCVCDRDLFLFGTTTVLLSLMYCQHPCLAFMNHTKNQTKWRKRKKGIIINWCLMFHRKIYCTQSVRSKNSENVNGHKSRNKMIAMHRT